MLKSTTLTVDFAGTREEAREFADLHRPTLHLAHKESPNGLPMLTARCAGVKRRTFAFDLLKTLGWDEEFVGVTRKNYVY
jgi:hypothetical protein